MQPNISDVYAEESLVPAKIVVLEQRQRKGELPDRILLGMAYDVYDGTESGNPSWISTYFGLPTVGHVVRGDVNSIKALGYLMSQSGWQEEPRTNAITLEDYFLKLKEDAEKVEVYNTTLRNTPQQKFVPRILKQVLASKPADVEGMISNLRIEDSQIFQGVQIPPGYVRSLKEEQRYYHTYKVEAIEASTGIVYDSHTQMLMIYPAYLSETYSRNSVFHVL